MPNNTSIQVRLTKNQKERIINRAEAKGYPRGKLSQFLRDLLLKEDYSSQRKIDAIYEKICGKKA